MGPKIQEVEIKFNIEDSFLQAALPFKTSYHKVEEVAKEPDSPEVVNMPPSAVIEESDEEGPLRVSTRGRFTYELDRYHKNAMLIFEGNASDVAYEHSEEDDVPQPEDMSTKFKKTFEKFGFEVKVYRNLTDEEIARTSETFFQQDFTEYGCVAVMMLAKTKDGIVESTHTPNTEFGVMRYLSDLMPPTLQDKPKIYIVQTEDFYVTPRARVWPTYPQDNLEFRVAVPIVTTPEVFSKRPRISCLLEQVHDKINALGGQVDLLTILNDTTNDYARTAEVAIFPAFYSTLTKELQLVRKPEP